MSLVFKADLKGIEMLERTVPANAHTASGRLANMLVDEIRGNWSPNSPSPWYAAPAVVTGTLDENVRAEPTGRNLIGRFSKEASMWTVQIATRYAGFLEHGTVKMVERPFVMPAVGRVAENMPEAYRDLFSFKLIG